MPIVELLHQPCCPRQAWIDLKTQGHLYKDSAMRPVLTDTLVWQLEKSNPPSLIPAEAFFLHMRFAGQ